MNRLMDIYVREIKPLPPRDRLRLLKLIADDLAQEDSLEPQPAPSILELEGLGAELWKGIDAQEYENELRREWDHRP